jgi:hypothetical protein
MVITVERGVFPPLRRDSDESIVIDMKLPRLLSLAAGAAASQDWCDQLLPPWHAAHARGKDP